jgi:hypothetical protein
MMKDSPEGMTHHEKDSCNDGKGHNLIIEREIAKAVLQDRLSYRPAARKDAKHELVTELEKRLPLGRSSPGEVIAILKSI